MYMYTATNIHVHAWAPAEIFPEGAKPPHFKTLKRFRCAVQNITIFRRAEGTNEKFCVFSRHFRPK